MKSGDRKVSVEERTVPFIAEVAFVCSFVFFGTFKA